MEGRNSGNKALFKHFASRQSPGLDSKKGGKGMYVLVSVIVCIGILLDERPSEVHVVVNCHLHFPRHMNRRVSRSIEGLYDSSFSELPKIIGGRDKAAIVKIQWGKHQKIKCHTN